MSKDSPQQQPQSQQSEEVDLGQLFKLIGNAFDRLFRFIGSIFKGVYQFVLVLLIHAYNRFIWYTAAVAIGFVAGFIIDRTSDDIYGANMFIETNFQSARQVYENIKQFHQLASLDKDTLELSKRLNITPSEAATLKGFYIEPDIDENTLIQMFSNYYMQLDSTSKTTVFFNDYKQSLNAYSYNIHKIGVATIDKFIYKKIEQAFIEGLSNNTYLDDILSVSIDNLNKEELALKEQLKKTDTLLNEYMSIRKYESQRGGRDASTNLYMGDAGNSTLTVDESRILEKRLTLEQQIRQVSLNKVEQKRIVNVLASFPNTGYDISEWTDKKKLVFPIILFALTLLIFGGLGLKQFLEEENKRQKA